MNLPSGLDLNPANTSLYVSNFGNSTISKCPVNGDGSLGTCVTIAAGTVVNPQAIRFNYAGTVAYVININSVNVCQVDSNGLFTGCVLTNGNGTFLRPQGISLNSTGTYAYVGNYTTNTVSICPVIAAGLFGTCVTSTGNGTFNFALNLVVGLNMMNSNNFGYVPNDALNTVSICPVNTSTGTLGICVPSTGNGTFNQPTFVAFGML